MSILRDVAGYLQRRKHASLNDLAMYFDTSPDAMRGMLDKWIAKGKVMRCPAAACQGCSSTCSAAPGEAYEWVADS